MAAGGGAARLRRGGRGWRGGLRGRGGGWLGFAGGGFDVGADDAAVGAGAFQGGEVDAGLLGHAAGQRADGDAGLFGGVVAVGGDGCVHRGSRAAAGGFDGGLGWSRRAVAAGGGWGGVGALAVFDEDGDGGVDLDVGGAVGDEDLAEDAFVDGFDFHGGFVGLDLGDDVAGL